MKQPHERAGPASLVMAPQRATGEPYTTSEIIAAGAGVQRRTVDHLLLAHKTDFEEFGILRFEIAKTGGRGRPEIIYHLNEQQATLLMTYLKNTEVVRAFKKELVRQFYHQEGGQDMKFCKGLWYHQGRTYATLGAALRAVWPAGGCRVWLS